MALRLAVGLVLAGLTVVPAAGGEGPPVPRVRDGVVASPWRLHPGTLVTPNRRVFRILVTESGCAGGQPATGRVEAPLIIRERTRVQVAMFVRPLDGPASCPSNPPTPYLLRLRRPLGDRTLADGGTIPPRPVRGRLTRAEYQRAIYRIVADTTEPTRLYDDLVVKQRPVAECARLMWKFTGRVGALLDRVGRLDPPPGAAVVQRQFLAAAWRSWHRLEQVARDVAAGSTRCGADLNERIYGMRSTKRAERAIERLERQGYRVFGE